MAPPPSAGMAEGAYTATAPGTSAAVRVAVVTQQVGHELRLVLGRDRRAVLDHAIQRLRPALRAEALLHGDLHAVTDLAAHDQLPAGRLGDLDVLRVSGSDGRQGCRQRDDATPHPP